MEKLRKMKNRFTLLSIVLLSFGITKQTQAAQDTSRIISAGSSITELIYALGADQQLIAVDVTSELPSSSKLPKVGYHRQLSPEGLLSLSPTRLIGSDEMGPKSTLKTLEQAGVEVDVIDTTATLEGLLHRIDQLAELTNTQTNSQQLKNQVIDKVNTLQTFNTNNKKRVLFLMISPNRPAVIGGKNTSVDKIIELSGAINPAAEKILNYKPLSMEALITMQPDAILVSERSWSNYKNADELLNALPMLKTTPAGKNKNILKIDGAALIGGIGLKSLDEALRLQQVLYPTNVEK